MADFHLKKSAGLSCIFASLAILASAPASEAQTAQPQMLYKTLATHTLPDGTPVASVIFERADKSATLMDVALDCDDSSYAYLAMDNAPLRPVSDAALDKLASQSEKIAATSLQSARFTPISDDPADGFLIALQAQLCGAN